MAPREYEHCSEMITHELSLPFWDSHEHFQHLYVETSCENALKCNGLMQVFQAGTATILMEACIYVGDEMELFWMPFTIYNRSYHHLVLFLANTAIKSLLGYISASVHGLSHTSFGLKLSFQ